MTFPLKAEGTEAVPEAVNMCETLTLCGEACWGSRTHSQTDRVGKTCFYVQYQNVTFTETLREFWLKEMRVKCLSSLPNSGEDGTNFTSVNFVLVSAAPQYWYQCLCTEVFLFTFFILTAEALYFNFFSLIFIGKLEL